MSLESDLVQPERQGDPPPPETPAPTQEAQPEPTAERDVAQDTLEIPDSSAEGGKVRYVPLSAVEGARAELKDVKRELAETKTSAARATELESRIAQLEAHITTIAPKAQAYDAAVLAQQHQPVVTEQTAEERAALEEIARDYDFYKADGALDIAKAERVQKRTRDEAARIAHQTVQPLAQQTVSQQSQTMLGRALHSRGKNGDRPDPDVLRSVWKRLDPALTATEEGAKQALSVAMGYTALAGLPMKDASDGATRGPDGQFTKKADIPPPLHTEKAGGKDTPDVPPLDDKERRFIKQMGMTEAEYLAATPSWMKK